MSQQTSQPIDDGLPADDDDTIVEVSLEELDAARHSATRDLATDEPIDTQYSDGSTLNPVAAQKQGLVYTPPSDPPVLPSDDPQNAQVAAGFATSMESAEPHVRRLPDHVADGDLALSDAAMIALRNNSETANLEKLTVDVVDGIAHVRGTVISEDDLARVHRIVGAIDGITDVSIHATVSS